MYQKPQTNNKGGYKNLLVYQLAVMIFDLNVLFISKYLDPIKDRRTIDQMHQAARSGKQNIVEGHDGKSLSSSITLTDVSRRSFAELLEDYQDFLAINKLEQWSKNDPRVLEVRKIRIDLNSSNRTNLSNWTNWTKNPESFANLMITLISMEKYLLDRLYTYLEDKFITKGGNRENLSAKRRNYRGY